MSIADVLCENAGRYVSIIVSMFSGKKIKLLFLSRDVRIARLTDL
jgi:hypothetical protein